jgi:ligand-binding sensor domain-containing protein/signal transduction histidine kinase
MHMNLSCHIRPFLLIALLLMMQAAHPASVLLDDSKGLSNNVISDITQDNKGLLWIGTHSGLNTYDGYVFREIPEFRSVHINRIRYDQYSDRMWVAASTGLFYIDVKTSGVINCTGKSNLRHAVEVIVRADAVFVAFHSGTVLRLGRTDSAKVLLNVKQLRSDAVINKAQMVTDQHHLYLSPSKFNKLIKLTITEDRQASPEIIDITGIKNMASYDSLFIINTESNGISVVDRDKKPLLSETISQLNKTNGTPEFGYYSNNKLYLAYKGSYWLYVTNIRTGKVNRMSPDDNSEHSRAKTIHCMYEDLSGVLWIGTSKGLVRSYEHPRFPYTHVLGNAMSPVSIRQITGGEPGHLYIASYNGIYRYGKSSGELLRIRRPEPTEDEDFPNYFRALLYDSNGYLYTGTESREYFFFRYNIRSRQFENSFFKGDSPYYQLNAAYSLLHDRHNITWIATDKGLASYDPVTRKAILHHSGKFQAGTNTLMSLSKSAQQNYFWAGGKNGLFLVHIVNGVEEHFGPSTKPALPDDEIIFVSEDPDQNVWIGYKKSGICVLDKNLRTVTLINRSNGLSSNEVYGILWQNRDTAWISTLNGLCRYAVRSGTFTNYFIENGLPDNEFNQNAFYNDGGELYFGGVNGIMKFTPPPPEKESPLTLFVSSVSKWDKKIQSFTDVQFNDSIGSVSMNPSDHLLTFTLGLSDYSHTEGNTYFYRIKGLYNEWISLGNQNVLRLDGLPAGTFTIQVIGFNKKGTRSVNTLNYNINIAQVFYKTAWFYLWLSLAVVALVYLYFKWRLLNLQRLQRLRTQIASNLHDEVGSLLTSIIISTDSARYSSDTIEEKDKKLEKVAALSRNATSTMSDVLWSIDSRNDYAGNLTDRMREHAEAMLIPLGLDLEFDFTETRQEQNIKPDTRQNLYLIFKESINNIAKHSTATIVKVYYKQHGSQFEMIIRNNNPTPHPHASVHQGQGLRNMEMRAGKISAVLKYEVSGNEVTVSLKSK